MIDAINPRLKAEFSFEEKQIHAFLNPYTYIKLRDKPGLIDQFDRVHFDGIFLCLIYKLFGLTSVPRRSFDMTSLARSVFADASRTGKTVAIIGAKEGLIEKAIETLTTTFHINVVLSRHGYFSSPREKSDFQDSLAALNPDIVVVGMGAVLQEQFLIELRARAWTGTGFTCGGFLHQTAERLEYYPRLMDKLNLRWVYRMFKDPYVIRRYGLDYPKFLLLFLKDYYSWRKNHRGR